MEEGARTFLLHVQSFLSGSAEDSARADSELRGLLRSGWIHFLRFAAGVCQAPEQERRVVNFCLVAIKDALVQRRDRSVESMRSLFMNPEVGETRNMLRRVIASQILSSDPAARNLAACCFAHIIQIEGVHGYDMISALVKHNEHIPEPVIIGVFNEMFCLKLFSNVPVDKMPSEFSGLLARIDNRIRDPKMSMECKVFCAACLRRMIESTPSFFRNDAAVDNFFKLICAVFPNANRALYVEMSIAMLNLVKAVYGMELSDRVMANVFNATVNGMRSNNPEMQVMSLEFWRMLWKYERSTMKRVALEKILVDPNYLTKVTNSITKQAAMRLVPVSVEMLMKIDPSGTAVSDKEESAFDTRVFKSMRSLVSSVATDPCDIGVIISLLNEVNNKLDMSSGWVAVNTGVYMLRTVIHVMNRNDEIRKQIMGFLNAKMGVVLGFGREPIPRLVDNFMNLLMDLAKRCEIILTDQALVIAIMAHATRVATLDQYFRSRALRLIGTVIKHAPPETVDEYFEQIYALAKDALRDTSFDDASYGRVGFRAMRHLIRCCSSRMNGQLIELMMPMLGFVAESSGDEKVGHIGIITRIIQKQTNHAGEYVVPRLDQIFGALFHSLESRADSMDAEMMLCFSSIIYVTKDDKTKIGNFAGRLFGVMRSALGSSDPALIRYTGLAIGDLCTTLASDTMRYLTGEGDIGRVDGPNVIDIMFEILERSRTTDNVTQQIIVPDLIMGMAHVFRGLGSEMRGWIDRFMQIIMFYAGFRCDLESKNDRDYAVRLYTGIFTGIESCIDLTKKERRIDDSFVQTMKSRVFPLFERACSLKSNNAAMLYAAMELLTRLTSDLGRSLCVLYRKKWVTGLVNLAVASDDEQLKKKGIDAATGINRT